MNDELVTDIYTSLVKLIPPQLDLLLLILLLNIKFVIFIFDFKLLKLNIF